MIQLLKDWWRKKRIRLNVSDWLYFRGGSLVITQAGKGPMMGYGTDVEVEGQRLLNVKSLTLYIKSDEVITADIEYYP